MRALAFCGIVIGLFGAERLSAQGVQGTSELEAKLYQSIFDDQIRAHSNKRYVGGWPVLVHVKAYGIPLKVKETDLFLPIMTSNALLEVSSHRDLPNLQRLMDGSRIQLNHYLQDAETTKEPEGTVAFWPLWKMKDGTYRRSMSTKKPYDGMNLPGDLDDASQAAAWFMMTNSNQKFVDGFVRSAGEFRDIGRPKQARYDNRWKKVNSGAFMTWAESETASGTRLTWDVNDVECVVNLNVLYTLGKYEQRGGRLPAKTRAGKESACRLVQEALERNNEVQCQIYYSRASQFLVAYARARAAEVDCLSPSAELARKLAIKEAQAILAGGKKRKNTTEMAEVLIALKTLFTKKERDDIERLSELETKLQEKMIASLDVRSKTARVKSADSLFSMGPVKDSPWWESRAFSAALVLQSLVIE